MAKVAKAKQEKSMEAALWDSANKLRGAVEPSEYKHVVLSLIFLKYASDKFEERRQELIDEGKEAYVDFVDFYTMKSVFYLAPESRWSYIMEQSKQSDIALKIDTALFTIEKNNPSLKGALPDNYYSRLGLDTAKLASLLDEINKIELTKDKEQDVMGRVYEYFLSNFALQEGKGVKEIAKILTANHIDTPQTHNEKLGLPIRSRSECPTIWNPTTVYQILDKEDYTGCTVNFKTKKLSYKSKEQINVPRDQWVIFENTQEAIIDKETFELVRRMRDKCRRVSPNKITIKTAGQPRKLKNMFVGKVFCADCGSQMNIHHNSYNKECNYLVCTTYRKKKKGECTSHRIRLDALEQIVLNDLRKISAYVAWHENEFVERYLNCSQKEKLRLTAAAKAEVSKAYVRQEELNAILRKLYEDNALGRITDDRYDELAASYENERKRLKERVSTLEASINSVAEDNANLERFISTLKYYINLEELTPEILHSFVDRIEVGEKVRNGKSKTQAVKIIYNFIGAVDITK